MVKKLIEKKDENTFEEWFKSPLTFDEFKKLVRNNDSIRKAVKKYKRGKKDEETK